MKITKYIQLLFTIELEMEYLQDFKGVKSICDKNSTWKADISPKPMQKFRYGNKSSQNNYHETYQNCFIFKPDGCIKQLRLWHLHQT